MKQCIFFLSKDVISLMSSHHDATFMVVLSLCHTVSPNLSMLHVECIFLHCFIVVNLVKLISNVFHSRSDEQCGQ